MAERAALRHVAAASAVSCLTVAVGMRSLGIVVAVVGAAALFGAAMFLRQARRHCTLNRGLRRCSQPARFVGVPVRVAPLRNTAFVAGLSRPAIYCSHDLPENLSEEELRAVTWHERAHQLARDPLRLTLLASIAPLVRRFPSGARWLEQTAADREIAADQFALARGVRRSAIASALLKVQPVSLTHAAGFSPAVELRLEALLRGTAAPVGRRPRVMWRSLIAGALVGITICATTPPVFAAVASTVCCG